MSAIDWKKEADAGQVTTRDGHPVRIYATDGNDVWPLHGAIHIDDAWVLSCWHKHGTGAYNTIDLVLKPKSRIKQKIWLNVYPDTGYNSRISADALAGSGRIACLEINLDFEEGEGLGGSDGEGKL